MSRARSLHAFLTFGIASFLAACGQGAPSASAPAPGGSAPGATTAPYSVAVGCVYAAQEYKPDQKDPDRVFGYPNAQPKSMTYDSSGNLYVGVWKGLNEYWVDEYLPGGTTVSRHITDGIYNPVVMTTDPQGDLYVANYRPRKLSDSTVTMYKPGSYSPDITIRLPAFGLAFYNDHLWFSNYYTNELRAYHIYPQEKKAVLAWTVTHDIHGPSQLSVTGENLYVLNQPLVGDDYLREYNVRGEPIFARSIVGNRHLIMWMTTDANENVYVAEGPTIVSSTDVAAWDRNGNLSFRNDKARGTVSLVASPTHYFVNLGNQDVFRYPKGDNKDLDLRLKQSDKCSPYANPITSLAIMQPNT